MKNCPAFHPLALLPSHIVTPLFAGGLGEWLGHEGGGHGECVAQQEPPVAEGGKGLRLPQGEGS